MRRTAATLWMIAAALPVVACAGPSGRTSTTLPATGAPPQLSGTVQPTQVTLVPPGPTSGPAAEPCPTSDGVVHPAVGRCLLALRSGHAVTVDLASAYLPWRFAVAGG